VPWLRRLPLPRLALPAFARLVLLLTLVLPALLGGG
jgi:hypothetical protein